MKTTLKTMGGVRRARVMPGVVGAATSLMVAGMAAGQFGPDTGATGTRMKKSVLTAPPAPPVPPAGATAGGSSSSFNMVVNENGRVIKIEMKDNVVTHAEVDGQTIPDDRIENDGGTVRLKDEKGEVLYQTAVGGGGLGGMDFGALAGIDPGDPAWQGLMRLGGHGGVFGGGRPRVFTLGSGNGLGATSSLLPDNQVFWSEPLEAPAVMMGVQLGSPDSTLCGHLGIERDKATLLTAVHEGLPAAGAGLEPYDIIVSVAGKDDANPAAVRAALKEKKAGDTVVLGVLHKGARKDIPVTLEGYDRRKLADSKVRSISGAEGGDVFALAPQAPSPPMPPLPPSIPEEYRKQIEQYYKENAAPRARAYGFSRRGGGGSLMPGSGTQDPGQTKKLLEEIERSQQDAARQAGEAAKRAGEMAERLRDRASSAAGSGAGAADMNERMRRMEEMLEKMMQQKSGQPKTQEPAGKDAGSRS